MNELDKIEEGAIIHMYDYTDKQDMWFIVKHGDKWWAVGISPDKIGKAMGGQKDLEQFKNMLSEYKPVVYTHKTHKMKLVDRRYDEDKRPVEPLPA